MLQLRLKSVRMQGFGAFDAETRVDLSVPAGLYLISGRNKRDKGLGSNGSGKSTLWDAICWCIFGMTSSGLKSPDMHSWNSTRSLFVEVEFDTVTLRREWNPNKLLANGVEVEDFRSFIPLTYIGFLSSLLFGQDTGSFLDLCHQDKTQFVSEALNLETWNQLSELAAKRSLSLKKEVVDLENQLIHLRGVLSSLTTDKLEADALVWDANHKEELRISRRDLVDVQTDIKETTKVFDEVEAAYQRDVVSQREAAIAFDRSKGVVTVQQSLMEVHRQAVLLMDTNLTGKEQQLLDLEKIKKCPCCGMFLTDKYRARSISRFQAEIDGDKERYYLAQDNVDVGDKHLEGLRDECDVAHRFLIAAEHAVKESKVHFNDLSHIIQELEKSNAVLEERIQSLEEESNPYAAQIRDIHVRRRAAQKESLACGKERTLKQAAQSSVEFWVQGFRDIRLQLIEDVLHHLSVVTTGKMESLGMAGWSVRYKIDSTTKGGSLKKGFSVQVRSPDSPDFVPWESWSGGERQRIRIASTLALSEVLLTAAGVEFDFELWDEPSTYITEEGFAEFLEILKMRSGDWNKRIFLTDHRQLDSGEFDGNLRITKAAGGASATWLT